MSNTKTVMGQASNQYVTPLDITDVFSTYLYDGNGVTGQTINNGIDLDGEGGLVWFKQRNAARDHGLFDTVRGANKYVISNDTNVEATSSTMLTAFNSNGFTLGGGGAIVNNGSGTYASWTFRKAPKFFTCLTYTGTGPGSAANEQQVSHDLGSKPGIVIIKRTDATGDWWVFTDVIDGSNDYGYLNQAAAFGATGNNVATDSVFSVGGVLNTSGATYTAYLFANNNGDGTFGPDGDQDVIKCGSFTTASSYGNINSIDLGWEAQFVLVKSTSAIGSWYLLDTMRGMPKSGNLATLNPNNSDSETAFGNNPGYLSPTATGFEGPFADLIGTSIDCVYIAIRRGPLAQPESATEVFAPVATDQTNNPQSGFPVDLWWLKARNGPELHVIMDRMRGTGKYLSSDSTAAEGTNPSDYYRIDNMTGGFSNGGSYSQYIHWLWKRAPGFFDVVAYTGNGTAGRTVSHNLGVAPEMLVVKRRDATSSWETYVEPLGNTGRVFLNLTNAFTTGSAWNNTSPTATEFTLGGGSTNDSGGNYIAYLFATLPGVSKGGSYTGNGTSQTIDCGFTSGARFVLLKVASTDDDWFLWDSVRGINAGTEPYLRPNLSAAEITTNDRIDPHSSGFAVDGNDTSNNKNGETYIFYAIA